jgi:crotonobetaine/carnitine-CoA ligase
MDHQTSIPALLARRAAENPDRVLMREVGGRSVSFGAFQDEALEWAGALAGLGIRAGDRVLTMLPPSIDAFSLWIGLAYLRAIETPCNTDYMGRMLSYLIANSGCRVAIVSRQWVDRFAAIADDITGLDTLIIMEDKDPLPDLPWRVVQKRDLLNSGSRLEGVAPPDLWDTAMMIYTSGTTGPSKGVLVPWGQQHQNAVGVIPADSLSEDDVYYSPFPLFHGSGRVSLCLMAIANGCVVIRSKFSVDSFWEDIRAYGCKTTAFMGAMSHFLWAQEPRDDDRDNPLERAIMLPVLPQWREFEERFGVELRTCFGMTEVSPPFGTGWDIKDPRSCGKLREGYAVRLVDEHDFEVPVGQVGELILRHDQPWTLSQGYFGLPEKTASAWSNGWFHTGDAFRQDKDGNYFFIDRFKDAIRRRGENISSFEVEAHVNAHPEVSESAAIAVPSEWSEDEVKIVVVLNNGSELAAKSLASFLTDTMPAFMVPRYIEFVDSLPKTDATLRVKKNELRVDALNAETWDREKPDIETSP